MPQPIGTVVEKPSVDFGPDTLDLYPSLAKEIARIVATWSLVENNIGLAFIMLVGSGSETSIAMYKSLTGSGSKDNAMNAAAKEKLSPSDYLIYQATRNTLKKTAKQRNNIVHGLIGRCHQIADALVVVHQDALFDQMNELFRKQHLAVDPNGVREDAEKRFASKAFVYREADFRKVSERLNWANDISQDLAVICAEVHPLANRSRSRLAEEPAIQREVRRLRKARRF